MLPKDMPPWQSAYYYYRKWRSDGSWDLIHENLRTSLRTKAGKSASPRVGLIDSQSVKSSLVGGVRGFDSGKKVKGIKRQIIVDTLGLLLAVVVHRADISDKRGGKFLLMRLAKKHFAFPNLEIIFADQGYRGLQD